MSFAKGQPSKDRSLRAEPIPGDRARWVIPVGY